MTGPGEASMQDLQASVRQLAAEGIKFIQVETPDINGTLRGKLPAWVLSWGNACCGR